MYVRTIFSIFLASSNPRIARNKLRFPKCHYSLLLCVEENLFTDVLLSQLLHRCGTYF